VGHDSKGLPIGLHLIGRPWQEATLLRVAKAFEVQFSCTIFIFYFPPSAMLLHRAWMVSTAERSSYLLLQFFLILDKTLNPKPSSLPLLCLVDEFFSIHSLQMLSTFFDVKVSQTCV
jgi:hypothetical protein